MRFALEPVVIVLASVWSNNHTRHAIEIGIPIGLIVLTVLWRAIGLLFGHRPRRGIFSNPRKKEGPES